MIKTSVVLLTGQVKVLRVPRQAAQMCVRPKDGVHSLDTLAGVDGFKVAMPVENQVQCLENATS